jgi:DNA-3-methyladenine glycosylase II
VTPLTEESFASAVDRLCSTDPRLGAVIETHGPPPFWTRSPGFATIVLFILEQQVSLASAAAAFRRLEDRLGAVTPEQVLACSDDALRADGFSRQKASYVRALAEAVAAGRLDLAAVADMSDDQARAALIALPGIGPWTADVYLLSCLRRPDIWPVGDRALQVGAAEICDLEGVPSAADLGSLGEAWRPDRSTAARIVWHGYLRRRGRATI